MDNITCPLCSGSSSQYYKHKERDFFKCQDCSSLFLHPKDYLTPEAEEAHYKHHNNNPEDTGYQNFVRPVVEAILKDFDADAKGLDFGSGTGSPIVKILEDNNYNISQYDLYFHNNQKALLQQYDYIAASEVAEHFKEPYKEFGLLKSLLKPNGKLYIMTELWQDSYDFASWYYKNDHTHVFLYHPDAFQWIRQEFGFRDVQIEKRVITLTL